MSPGVVFMRRKLCENMDSSIIYNGVGRRQEFLGMLHARRSAALQMSSSCSGRLLNRGIMQLSIDSSIHWTHQRQILGSAIRSSRKYIRCEMTFDHHYQVTASFQEVKLRILHRNCSTWAASLKSHDEPLCDEECSQKNSSGHFQIKEDSVQEEEREGTFSEEVVQSTEVISISFVEEAAVVSRNNEAGEDNTLSEDPNLTVIAFDIETTGFKASDDRIIEFAARDLAGGDFSTLCALVNPGRHVPYFISEITGITNEMVNQPHIPSWKEVGPIILRFVESRRQGDGPVILVAHNGRRFDVPFLLREFQDCSIEVPAWWLFLDSMPLARETKKKFGYNWRSLKLSDIHEGYGLQTTERAHRAMADVHMLASVLGMIVCDLQLPVSEILQRSFNAEDIFASSKLFQVQGDRGTVPSEGDLLPDLSVVQDLAKEESFEAPWEDEKHIDVETEEVEVDMLMEGSGVNFQGSQKKLRFSSHDVIPGVELPSTKSFLDSSSVDAMLLSPMLKQYVETKRKKSNFVHFLKVGDFYEAFFEDAETLGRTCKARVSLVDDGKMKVPVARFPESKANVYSRLLLKKGLKVIKLNQFGADEGREVAAVLTPGMLLDEGMCDETCNNYLVALTVSQDPSSAWGLAFCDLLTGELYATQSESQSILIQELHRLEPAEIILASEGPVIDMPCNLFCSTRPLAEFSAVTNDSAFLSYVGSDIVDVLRQWPFADRAAGALFRYVQQTQAITFEELPIRKLCLYSTEDYLFLDESVRNCLELIKTSTWGKQEGSLLWAMDDTRTVMGSRLIRKWILQPLLSPERIVTRQDAVEVLSKDASSRAMLRSYLSDVMDIERLAGSIARKSPVAWEDLLGLAESLLMIPNISSILDKFPENSYFSAVMRTPAVVMELAKEIQGMLVGDTARRVDKELVKDGIDEVLDKLRAEIRDCERFMEEFLKHEQASSLEGTTNGKPTRKRKTKADANASNDGRLEFLECERRRFEAVNKSCEREEELLEVPRKKLTNLLKALQETSQALAALDVLCSFAEIAATRDYCRPQLLRDGREITIVGGRHPVVEINKEFTPNSCYLGYQSEGGNVQKEENACPRPDLLILTGPNASGKSCYLQQVALIQVLTQCGSFVPAREARLSIADAIYTIGQSDAATQSADILKRATCNSLVLLDEFRQRAGSHEDEAISRAVIEYLAEHVRTRTMLCTEDQDMHLQEFPNISNYHFASLGEKMKFNHTIRPGFAPQLSAIGRARTGGYPKWVCSRAAELLGNFNNSKGHLKKDVDRSPDGRGAYNLWHRIMNFTKVKTSSKESAVVEKDPLDKALPLKIDAQTHSRERLVKESPSNDSHSNSQEDLEMLWQQVSAMLQNSPATLALAQQKGSLVSISKSSQPAVVTIGSSPLFVRKFKQHEHAAALEAAFESILNQPVKLHVSVERSE